MRATTQQLEAFTAIVERQGITAAADQLGWSKSKVSKVISELEAQIGVTLFYRSTRGLRVTSEGLSFYQDVVEYLSAMDASIDRLTESAPNARGTSR